MAHLRARCQITDRGQWRICVRGAKLLTGGSGAFVCKVRCVVRPHHYVTCPLSQDTPRLKTVAVSLAGRPWQILQVPDGRRQRRHQPVATSQQQHAMMQAWAEVETATLPP